MSNKLFEDIDGNVDALQAAINVFVQSKRELREEQRVELESLDAQMLAFLWECKRRRYLSTAMMARMIGISRQRLYQKWEQHGYKIND